MDRLPPMRTAAPPLFPIDDAAFLTMVQALAAKIRDDRWQADFLIGVGRGGLVPAVYLSQALDLPMLSIDHSAKLPDFADELLAKVATMTAAGRRFIIVDDINDSGGTIATLRTRLAEHGAIADHVRFAVLLDNIRSQATVDHAATQIDRHVQKDWFVFPWEAVAPRDTLAEDALSVPERLG